MKNEIEWKKYIYKYKKKYYFFLKIDAVYYIFIERYINIIL